MKMSFILAWRNIWRNPRRTILTMLGISFACMVIEFFVGLQNSSYETSINASINVFTGHLQIQRKGYFEKPQVRLTISNPDQLIEKIKQFSEIALIASRASAFALVSSSDRTYGVQIVGIQPRYEVGLSTISGVIRKGQYLLEHDNNAAVIGSTLAKNLKVEVGDDLTILGQGADGSLAASVLNLVGIFESGVADMDRSMIEVPLEYFQETFSTGKNVHSIVIRVKDFEKLIQTQSNLRQAIEENLEVLRWDQLLPGLKQAIDLDRVSGRIFLMSLVIVVSLTILNTFLMAVLERKREFAVVLALGQKPISLTLVVLLESMILTMLGIMLGVIAGSLIILFYGVYGFQVPGSEALMKHWNLPAAVYTKLSVDALIFGPIVVSICSFLSAHYPAIRAPMIELNKYLRTS